MPGSEFNPKAQQDFADWIRRLCAEIAKPADSKRRMHTIKTLLPLYGSEDKSGMRPWLLAHRDFGVRKPINEALEAERFTLLFELLARARDEIDAQNPEDEFLFKQLVLIRSKAFRDLGLIDRAVDLLPELVLEIERLRRLGSQPEALSQLVMHLAVMEIAQRKWARLLGWLGDSIDARELRGDDLMYARYFHAYSLFEAGDRAHLGAVDAMQELEELTAEEGLPLVLRSQIHLRWARIGMHQGELELARVQLDEAAKVAQEIENPSAAENAHRLVFQVRLAREQGRELGELQADLLRQWRGMLAAWRRAPLRPGGLGYLTFDNHRRVVDEVLRVLLESEGEQAAFNALFDLGKVGTLSKVLGLARHAPDVPRPGPSELLLTYHTTPRGTHLFALTSAGLRHYFLEVNGPQLEELIASFQSVLRKRPKPGAAADERADSLRQRSIQLRRLLLPCAVESLLEEHPKLNICGADQLDHLAFEALSSEAGEALGLSHDLVYLPSLPLASQLMDCAFEASAFRLLGGASEMGLGPGWDAELLRPYARAMAGHAAQSSYTEMAGEEPLVVQLFGHGVLDYERELIATIALDAGPVGYAEVMGSACVPRLALLTACRGWNGPGRKGDAGAGHLGSAFFQRGTPTVILADADVSVAGSLAWSEAFHVFLASGASPASAARQARQALAHSAEYSDPFYYSLLHVVGVGQRSIMTPVESCSALAKMAPPKESVPGWRKILAGAGVLILLGILAQALRRRR